MNKNLNHFLSTKLTQELLSHINTWPLNNNLLHSETQLLWLLPYFPGATTVDSSTCVKLPELYTGCPSWCNPKGLCLLLGVKLGIFCFLCECVNHYTLVLHSRILLSKQWLFFPSISEHPPQKLFPTAIFLACQYGIVLQNKETS